MVISPVILDRALRTGASPPYPQAQEYRKYSEDYRKYSPCSLIEKALLVELRPVRNALAEIAEVLGKGHAKHPNDDGFKQPATYHISRAQQHLAALADCDTAEDHVANAACRLLMALEARSRE